MAKVSVSEADVKKIALLSRLRLEGSELKSLTNDFNQILEFVADLDKVDLEHADPVTHVLDLKNIARPDETRKAVALTDIEKIAPEFEHRSFVVPRVIEEES